MKKLSALAALYSVTLALPCAADTFTLKDGTKLDAKIVKEEGDSYVLEVQVTKSIKDERTIAKADVVKIDRDQPDLLKFEEIKKLVPVPDLLTADDYSQNIAVVDKFLKDYKTSSKAKDAKAILDTLKAESVQVSGGSLKLNGAMVSPQQYEANAYELDARVLEAKINTYIRNNQVVAALRAFTDLDRDYRTTLSYGALSPVIQQLIKSYAAETDESLRTLDARTKQRAAGLSQMASEDRKITEAAIAEENQLIDARYKSEKASKVVWVTTSPFHKASLDDASKFAQAELKRLSTVKTALGVDGGKAYREAFTAVRGEAKLTEVTAALSAAKTAGVVPRYLAPLEAAAKGRK